MLREDGAETRGRPGAPRSQTKREGPFREAPRREGVQSGSQAPASTLGGKRFTLSRPRPQCPVTKAPGHSYRWGGDGRPFWGAELLVPVALRDQIWVHTLPGWAAPAATAGAGGGAAGGLRPLGSAVMPAGLWEARGSPRGSTCCPGQELHPGFHLLERRAREWAQGVGRGRMGCAEPQRRDRVGERALLSSWKRRPCPCLRVLSWL